MIPIFDRHIVTEFFHVLCIGTLTVLGIFFGTIEFQNAMEMLGTFDVSLQTILTVMLLQIPTGAMYALPAGLLFSTMFVLFRLNRDYELTALRTLGVSLRRIMLTFLLIGAISAVTCFTIAGFVAPPCKYLATKLLRVSVHQTARPFPKKNRFEIADEKGIVQQVIIMGKNLDSRITNFLVLDVNTPGTVSIIWSRFAEWQDANWKLTDGQLFDLLAPGARGPKGTFKTMLIPGLAPCFRDVNRGPTDALEMTTTELYQAVEKHKAKNEPVPPELLLNFYRRFTQALSCLLLVIAGAPVALVQKRQSTFIPLIYAGIMVPLYFILQQACLSLATNGIIDPLLGASLPSCTLALIGLIACVFMRR